MSLKQLFVQKIAGQYSVARAYATATVPATWVVKGIGEIAIVGVAAAVSNAILNVTGRRLRDLP